MESLESRIVPSFLPALSVPTGDRANGLVAADFNADGLPDLASADHGSGEGRTVSVMLGNGDGTFQDAVPIPHRVDSLELALADLDLDGRLDLVLSRYSVTAGLWVLPGNGDGTFRDPECYPTGGTGARTPAVADFNLDGWLDVAVVNALSDFASVFLNVGDWPGGAPGASGGAADLVAALAPLRRDRTPAPLPAPA